MASADLPFPQCCAACPHRSSFTASCTHDFRQSVIQSLDETRPCPVYVDEKTEAMRTLARSLDRT
ncbi:hypothetical protein [Halobellus litoreus]|uniref:Uncharacterized protein n=1 Tax=Halobellus litoreus TaxID=755310 RepID=A0ABD6E2N9_9EURY|nr:hypothetical protein [Halobellus litoreus]